MISRLAELALAVATSSLWLSSVNAQTFTSCNPLTSTCPPDTALGRSVTVDFTKGASNLFSGVSAVSYAADGAHFTVAKSGDSPQINSNFYIMFGSMSVTMKAAPGKGIVSSVVLQSDDLDEIDWEWLGADDTQVQSNYFGKGQTITYDRGAFHAAPGNQDAFHTYTVDWTANQISWIIDGATVRTLLPANSKNQYPQTPMQVKIGAWSGGDPKNAPGTIQWAQGPTNYANGPYTMVVSAVTVTDYSTGKQYQYNGNSGSWQSIVSIGGTINPNGPAGGSASTQSDNNSPPPPPAPSSTKPAPVQQQTTASSTSTTTSTSTHVTPSIYPWVPSSQTTLTTKTSTVSYPGLPSGWTVTDTGKVIPPSSAPASSTPTCYSSPQELRPDGASLPAGASVVTYFDQRGFACLRTDGLPSATATQVPAAATDSPATSLAGGVDKAATSGRSSTAVETANAANANAGGLSWGVVVVGGVLAGVNWLL